MCYLRIDIFAITDELHCFFFFSDSQKDYMFTEAAPVDMWIKINKSADLLWLLWTRLAISFRTMGINIQENARKVKPVNRFGPRSKE